MPSTPSRRAVLASGAALATLTAAGPVFAQATPDRAAILAIGDGPETDIRGAAGYGIDALLVAEGVTDASAGLHVVEEAVRQAVPHARIVATVHDLSWT